MWADAVRVVDTGGPKAACVTCTLAQPDENDCTVHVRVGRMKVRRCGLMSNFFDDLLLL